MTERKSDINGPIQAALRTEEEEQGGGRDRPSAEQKG